MNSHLVSIVIPSYNSQETIQLCIESFLIQTYKPIEILVVDDGSTDNTCTIAKKYTIKVIKSSENRGPAHARNLGAHHARGDILVFAESDATYSPDYIETIIQPLDNETVGGAMCGKRIVWSNKSNLFIMYQNLQWEAAAELTKKGIRPVIGAWAFRKETFNQLGGYNETLRQGEDVEFVDRLKSKGYTVAWLSGGYMVHKDPDTLRAFLRDRFNRLKTTQSSLKVSSISSRVRIRIVIESIHLALQKKKYLVAIVTPFIFIFCSVIPRLLKPFYSWVYNKNLSS